MTSKSLYKLDHDDFMALRSYAEEFGRNWKESLVLDWYNARTRPCQAMPNRGSILHGLRNQPGFGHEGLKNFRLALDNGTLEK